ncbi:MAG TPA: helix-turn-helix domain-containing protein [Sphingomicrobium sp.]|nr:helix-turn-helix domain-containing protein [Sphingomicrobium sp.]
MQQGFGQFCPLALASEVLTQRWMLLILRELGAGSARFNDIRRGVPRISASLLKERLDSLQAAGIVEQSGSGQDRRYRLTEAGHELKPILSGIGAWGQRWARDIRPDDLDPGWLVWNIHRRLNLDAMPEGPLVIEFRFVDARPGQRRFWLLRRRREVEVCLKPPGRDSDLVVETGVQTLAEIWRGLRPIAEEIAAGRLRLDGPTNLRRTFPGWLLLSVYAPIERRR